jgi:hypothetical protein
MLTLGRAKATQSERSIQMLERKQRDRMLGLLIVTALGALAFAASAQAIAPGFLVHREPAGDLLPLIEGTLEGTGTMLVAGLNFELNCTTMATDEGIINTNTDAKIVLLYSGCSTLILNKLPTAEEVDCHVSEPIRVEALLLPTELLKPFTDEPAILAEKIKALIVFHLKGTAQLKEKPCILPLDNTVTGEVCFEIVPGTNDTLLPLLIAGAGIECLDVTALESLTLGFGFTDKLKYGAQIAVLDVGVFLDGLGAHKDSTFGVSLY